MERLGYITRRQLGTDRKKIYVFLTPKGRALKGHLVPAAEAVNAIAVDGIRPAEVAATRAVPHHYREHDAGRASCRHADAVDARSCAAERGRAEASAAQDDRGRMNREGVTRERQMTLNGKLFVRAGMK